ncbi:MAG: PmoA family protein [Verrucomicrobiota bacterium]
MIHKTLFPQVVLALLVSTAISSPAQDTKKPSAAKEGVSISEQEGKLRIEINGELFSEYYYQDVSRPFLYPLIGPGGAPMTRNWPMKNVENEEHDHPHHRSFWYAHGDVNGHDFWSEGSKAGKTVQEKFTEIKSGPQEGIIKSQNKLVALDGQVICTDERTLRFYNRPNERLFDFEITIHASQGAVTFGDTKEGTMGLRLAETMRLKGKVGQGHIVNSEGVRDGQTWGKRAKWVDYYGPVNGQTVGVAIFDHPQNPRYPTWWHVRDYGLFAVNPFGLHDFEKQPAGAGNLVIPAGQSVTFRYRFYLHPGDEKEAKVAERYSEYAADAAAK